MPEKNFFSSPSRVKDRSSTDRTLALVPTLIGHTSFNNALHFVRAGWLSAVTLVEPVLAGAVAYFAWGEDITARVALGYLLVCLSVIVLVLDRPGSRGIGASIARASAREGADRHPNSA